MIDHFHGIKLMNEKIDQLRRALQKETAIMEDGPSRAPDTCCCAGRKTVSPERVADLEVALKLNNPLSIAYYLKEELRPLLKLPGFSTNGSVSR